MQKNITICMGSSCFSRGNNENLKLIKDLLEGRPESEVYLTGALCQEQCSKGPVIYLGDEMVTNVDMADVENLVTRYLEQD